MIGTVFTEMQPFKGVENYFTDSLLYKQNSKVIKKSLPNDTDSGNEADSESGEDPTVSFDEELIIAYLDDPDCNNSADNSNEWILNENINFDYSLCCDDVYSHIDMSPLYMPLPMSTTCMHIEENDGSIFVVPSSKKDQSPIIFGRVRHWITSSKNSDKDLEPPQFFHYAW